MKNRKNTVLPTALIQDEHNAEMSMEQLNEYLIKRTTAMREYAGKERSKYNKINGMPHTTNIIPPMCYSGFTLYDNIKNMLACYSNTLSAALFCESRYIRIFNEFEALDSVIDEEKRLIYDFLSKNDLIEKFNTFTTITKLSAAK